MWRSTICDMCKYFIVVMIEYYILYDIINNKINNKREIIMAYILTYCEKCGCITFCFNEDTKNELCMGCQNIGFVKPIPKEYLDEDGDLIISLEEDFIEKVIKSSPNFEQSCLESREEFEEVRKHQDEMIRTFSKGQSSIPKCPTCSSTNIKKVSVTSKLANTALFGIFGTKRHKIFHCNNCGYEW